MAYFSCINGLIVYLPHWHLINQSVWTQGSGHRAEPTILLILTTTECILGVSIWLGFKVTIISKFSIFLSDSIYHPMNFCEKYFDLNKMQSFLEVLKTFKFASTLVHHSLIPLVWNELWRRFRNMWLQASLISLILPL